MQKGDDMKNGVMNVKKSDISAKIDTHTENLKAVNQEIVQLQQALQERSTQKVALEGAVAGLQELIPDESKDEVQKAVEAK